MVDIESAAAEIRRGKKIERKNIELECGPMPNVMAALSNRWRPLFNAVKFG